MVVIGGGVMSHKFVDRPLSLLVLTGVVLLMLWIFMEYDSEGMAENAPQQHVARVQ
jgi:hypothetical protein